MHELGVVFTVADTVRETATACGAVHVDSVTLQVGEVTGIVPDYLVDCWNWAAGREELLKGAELVIEPIEAVSHCEDCGAFYKTVQYGRTCPECGSGHTFLDHGKEFIIKDISVQDP